MKEKMDANINMRMIVLNPNSWVRPKTNNKPKT